MRDIDLESVRQTFPYLVDRSLATGSGYVGACVRRDIAVQTSVRCAAKLNFHTFTVGTPFVVAGVDVLAINVEHGAPCMSVALRFGDVGARRSFARSLLLPS